MGRRVAESRDIAPESATLAAEGIPTHHASTPATRACGLTIPNHEQIAPSQPDHLTPNIAPTVASTTPTAFGNKRVKEVASVGPTELTS